MESDITPRLMLGSKKDPRTCLTWLFFGPVIRVNFTFNWNTFCRFLYLVYVFLQRLYLFPDLWECDLGLIKVEKDLRNFDPVGIIPMVPAGTPNVWPIEGTKCFAHGWGCTTPGMSTHSYSSYFDPFNPSMTQKAYAYMYFLKESQLDLYAYTSSVH